MSGIAGRIITIHHGGGESAPAAPVKLLRGPLENKHLGYESSDLSVALLQRSIPPSVICRSATLREGRGAGLRCRGLQPASDDGEKKAVETRAAAGGVM